MPENSNYLNTENSFLTLILALNRQEWKRFEAFVRSPFFNKKQQLVNLYELISKRYPFKKGLYKTDLLPVLHKKQPYPKQYTLSKQEDGLLRKLLMEFTQLLKEFIIYETSKTDETARQRHLIDFLMARKQHRIIPKLLLKETKRTQQSDPRNRAYYNGQFLLAEADFFMTILSNDQSNTSKLESANQSIIDYFTSTLLSYYSAALNRESILQVKHSYPLLEPILDYTKANLKTLTPLTLCYYHIFLMNRDKSSEHFEALKRMTLGDLKFDDTTKRQIYSYMLNFCSQNIRLGHLRFKTDKHEIYTWLLEGNLLSAGIYFSAQHYLLIAKNAMKLGLMDWAWEFLNNYKFELNPAHRSQHLLVLAHFYFYNKAYDDALSCLLKINYAKDFFSILNYRILWIQIHYENPIKHSSRDEHPVYHALEALRQFLTNETKMSERISTSFQNFMRFSKRLFKFKQQPKYLQRKSILQRLITDIREATYLDERDWLLGKAKEIKTNIAD